MIISIPKQMWAMISKKRTLTAILIIGCCQGPLLFQQQPTDLATESDLASAAVGGCSWLHLNSASSSEHSNVRVLPESKSGRSFIRKQLDALGLHDQLRVAGKLKGKMARFK
jgi:hypothetical protein